MSVSEELKKIAKELSKDAEFVDPSVKLEKEIIPAIEKLENSNADLVKTVKNLQKTSADSIKANQELKEVNANLTKTITGLKADKAAKSVEKTKQ